MQRYSLIIVSMKTKSYFGFPKKLLLKVPTKLISSFILNHCIQM